MLNWQAVKFVECALCGGDLVAYQFPYAHLTVAATNALCGRCKRLFDEWLTRTRRAELRQETRPRIEAWSNFKTRHKLVGKCEVHPKTCREAWDDCFELLEHPSTNLIPDRMPEGARLVSWLGAQLDTLAKGKPLKRHPNRGRALVFAAPCSDDNIPSEPSVRSDDSAKRG